MINENSKTTSPDEGVPRYKYELSLADTATMMTDPDYKVRFIAEYAQTKIRYEKLKHLLTRWEAFNSKEHNAVPELSSTYIQRLTEWLGFLPTCPFDLLLEQQHQMGMLLHTLELRAALEGIDLRLVTIKL